MALCHCMQFYINIIQVLTHQFSAGEFLLTVVTFRRSFLTSLIVLLIEWGFIKEDIFSQLNTHMKETSPYNYEYSQQ